MGSLLVYIAVYIASMIMNSMVGCLIKVLIAVLKFSPVLRYFEYSAGMVLAMCAE